jgi:hypothetical protein
MGYFATAGSKVYIGGAKVMQATDFAESDFSSVSWTEIKGLESIGNVGSTATAVDVTAIGDNGTRTLKGQRSGGSMELSMFVDYADAGQLALVAAEKTDDDYAFKVEFDDAPSGGTPSLRLFIGKVMSAVEALDQANNAAKLTASIAINSNIVRVAASA